MISLKTCMWMYFFKACCLSYKEIESKSPGGRKWINKLWTVEYYLVKESKWARAIQIYIDRYHEQCWAEEQEGYVSCDLKTTVRF